MTTATPDEANERSASPVEQRLPEMTWNRIIVRTAKIFQLVKTLRVIRSEQASGINRATTSKGRLQTEPATSALRQFVHESERQLITNTTQFVESTSGLPANA